jgi:hypothetical protein
MYTRWHSQAPSAETQWQPETKEQLAVPTAIVPTATKGTQYNIYETTTELPM